MCTHPIDEMTIVTFLLSTMSLVLLLTRCLFTSSGNYAAPIGFKYVKIFWPFKLTCGQWRAYWVELINSLSFVLKNDLIVIIRWLTHLPFPCQSLSKQLGCATKERLDGMIQVFGFKLICINKWVFGQSTYPMYLN